MTPEEAIEVLGTYDMSEDNDDTEFKDAVRVAINSMSAIEGAKREILALSGDNFPNSFYVKIIDKHIREKAG